MLIPCFVHIPPHHLHLPLLADYFPIKSGLVEALKDFFHPGAGGYTELFQVVAGEGWLDIAELIKKQANMLTGYGGVSS